MDNPKDAAFLEEEAMKAKERESSTQKQKPKDEHFTKLQDELMAEIEAETRKMVEDAGIVSVDEMFLSEKEAQNDGYTIDGAPNAEFVSVEKQVSESKLALRKTKILSMDLAKWLQIYWLHPLLN